MDNAEAPGPPGICASSPECVKVLGPDGAIRHFNADGLRLMEIDTLDQVAGKYWPDLWPDAGQQFAAAALTAARETGVATFSAPCPTARGTPKHWSVTVATMPGDGDNFIVISRDITEEYNAERERRLDHERLTALSQSNSDAAWDIDLANGRMWWGSGILGLLGYQPGEIEQGLAWWQDRIHADDHKRVVASAEAAFKGGAATWEQDFRFRKADGSYLEVSDRGSIVRDAEGQPLRFLGLMQDNSAYHRSIEAQKALAGEMAHRVANVLAVVGSLFQQTASRSDSVPALALAFGNRVKALAAANTAILRASSEGGLHLANLIEVQLGHVMEADRLTLTGPAVEVPEPLVQPLALALHELATNALKHGALSVDAGRVELGWTVDSSGERPTLTIDWTERGGPSVSQPVRTGLGSRLIDHGIHGATISRRFDPAGFRCQIVVPL